MPPRTTSPARRAPRSLSAVLAPFAAAAAVAACGGSAPKAKEAAPAAIAKPAGRAPAEKLAKRWTLGDAPPFAVHVDAAGLAKTELVSGLLPALQGLAEGKLDGEPGKCLGAVLASVDEVLVGAKPDHMLALASFDRARVPAGGPSLEACLALRGAKAEPPAGAKAAVTTTEDGVEHLHVLTDDLYVGGTPDDVKAALASATGKAPSGLELGEHQYVALRAKIDDVAFDGGAKLFVSPAAFRVEASGDVGAPGVAAKMESEYEKTKATPLAGAGLPPEAENVLARLKDALSLKRTGDHLDVAFDLRGSPMEQARDLGAAAALAANAVKRYLVRSKLAEASVIQQQIARAYVGAWEKQDPKKRAKKLWAFPPVPAKVPALEDKAVELKAASWAAWKAIDFAYEGPAKFQHEVVVDKAGTGAKLVSRGAVDERGVTVVSTPMALDPKTSTIHFGDTQIEEPGKAP